MNIKQTIVEEVLSALEADKLDLPVLPDMTRKVRHLICDPDSSTGQFVKLISTDLAISLYIIKAANSAAYAGIRPVANLHDAIPRLGYRLLYSMVMDITLSKLFTAKNPLINRKLKELWERSRTVAATSYVLAQKRNYLKPDDAILAGLVHEIGALPLYLYADRHHSQISAEVLDGLIQKFSPTVGVKLLQSWNFPDELVDVISGNTNQTCIVPFGIADYVDVVIVADLLVQSRTKPINWRNIRSAEALGCYAKDCENFLTTYAEQLAEVNDLLGIGHAQAA